MYSLGWLGVGTADAGNTVRVRARICMLSRVLSLVLSRVLSQIVREPVASCYPIYAATSI